jgi:hypothetical protein
MTRFILFDSIRYPNNLMDKVNDGLPPSSRDYLHVQDMGGWEEEIAISEKHTSFADIEHVLMFAYRATGGLTRNFNQAYKMLHLGGVCLIGEGGSTAGATHLADSCFETWQGDFSELRELRARQTTLMFNYFGYDFDNSSSLMSMGTLVGNPNYDVGQVAFIARILGAWRARTSAQEMTMDEM